jgi:DNA-binding NarL/FixJ family response regulator
MTDESGASDIEREARGERESGTRITEVGVGSGRLVVLSFPIDGPELPEELTPAEREVAEALLRGESNREIAARRGTSDRTVANQISSIFEKTGVYSRSEFVREMTADGDDS